MNSLFLTKEIVDKQKEVYCLCINNKYPGYEGIIKILTDGNKYFFEWVNGGKGCLPVNNGPYDWFDKFGKNYVIIEDDTLYIIKLLYGD